MTPERLEEIKKNVDLWLDDDGSVVELINALEEAWADNHDLSEGIDGMIADREYFEKIAEQAEAEVERLKNETIYRTEYEVLAAQVQYQHQHRNRKWLVQELHGLQDAYNTLEDDRDKWMGQFDEAEHRGLAYMEERDKLESMFAGLTDWINVEARECGVAEAKRPNNSELRSVIRGIVDRLRGQTDKLAAKLKEYEAFNEPLKRVYNENTAKEATP